MSPVSERLPGDFAQALEALAQAPDEQKAPTEFWVDFLASLSGIGGAAFAVLNLRSNEFNAPWQTVGLWPEKPGDPEKFFLKRVEECADLAAQERACLVELEPPGEQRPGAPKAFAAGVRVPAEGQDSDCVACFLLTDVSSAEAEQALQRLALAADSASIYQLRRSLSEARIEVEHFAAGVDLVAVLNQNKKFVALAVALCNEIANRQSCERVSLGWMERNGFIRLASISHTEKFERKMDVVSRLETAMEEALEQDQEVRLPFHKGDAFIALDHKTYAELQGVKHLVSFPLRLDGEGVGVITCERQAKGFSEHDQRLLRICADLSTRRLYEVKRQDRWFGARWWVRLHEGLGVLIGSKHTFVKAVSLLLFVLLVWFLFGSMDYRVEGTFSAKTENQAQIPAPFEGYIRTVVAEVGDEVEENAMLLELDTGRLKLDQASATAEMRRYQRDSDKARAENRLADMRISTALADEAEARLDMILFRLDHARITSPIAGVVVDGDHKERIGSPVQTGEVLYRVARLDDLYVECDVEERDIHKLQENAPGEIAFASRPKHKFPVTVERIYPASRAGQQGNIFLLRCRIDDEVQDWWRPGMTGIVKVEAGRRRISWVYTHKTIDFLRMWLWQ